MFVRRSRKGRIHVVRERVADGYARLSKGLARANKGVIDGVWSVHKGLQLGLAKGHQGVQSGLKTVQDFTGDFSMYYQRNSYYQYEEPVAMFSLAEVEKYNRYGGGGYFVDDWGQYANFARMQQGSGGTTYYVNPQSNPANRPAAPKKLTGTAKQVRSYMRAAGDIGRSATSTASGGLRGLGVQTGKGLANIGRTLRNASPALGNGLLGNSVKGLGGGVRGLGSMIAKNPRLAGAAMLAGAAGAGGSVFMRRRRTKTGKIVVEQVRR